MKLSPALQSPPRFRSPYRVILTCFEAMSLVGHNLGGKKYDRMERNY